MSIAQAEQLKRELTDKFVVVQDGIPELKRFSGLTGQVKTVNMNCRVLVQFDGPVDISWYDIDPNFLRVVTAPQPKAKADHAEKPAAKADKPAPAAGKSPLETARQQGAAKAAPAAAPAAAPPSGEKKLSPLELARQQGAAKPQAAASAPAAQAAAATPTPASAPSSPAPVAEKKAAGPAGGAPKSTADILALARKQGAKKD